MQINSAQRGAVFSWEGEFNVTLDCDKPIGVVAPVCAIAIHLVELNIQSYLPGGANVHPS